MIKYIFSALLVIYSFTSFAQMEIIDKVAIKKDQLRLSSVQEAFQLSAASPHLKLAEEADKDLHDAIITRSISKFIEFYDKLVVLEAKTGKTPEVFSNLGLLSAAGTWIQKDQNIDDFNLSSLLSFTMDNSSTKSLFQKMAKMQKSKSLAMPSPAPAPSQRGASTEAPVYELQVINQHKEPIYLYHNGVYHSKVYAGKTESLRLNGGCQSFEIETRQGPVTERSICFTEEKKVNWTLN